jgi:hypothetical protein
MLAIFEQVDNVFLGRRLSGKKAVGFFAVEYTCEANAHLLIGTPDQLARPIDSAVFREGKEELPWNRNVGIKRKLGSGCGDVDNLAFVCPCAVYRDDGRFPVHPPPETFSLIMKHAANDRRTIC